MEPSKKASKLVLGGSGVIGLGTVITLLWSAIGNAESRVTAQHDKDIAQVKSEIKIPLEFLAKEVCLVRYRLDVQAGVPNPGGCGK